MLRRLPVVPGLLLVVCTFCLLGWMRLVPAAHGQRPAPEATNSLYIGYPGDGVLLGGGSNNVNEYKGVITVRVYAITPRLKARFGEDAVLSADLVPGNTTSRELPLGKYEVHFTARYNDEVRTLIQQNVIVQKDRSTQVLADIGPRGGTLILGDVRRAQQMQSDMKTLILEVRALRAEVAALRKGK